MKKIFFGLLAAMLLCMSVTGIHAYLTSNDSAKNAFTVGENDAKVEEPDFEPQPEVKAGTSCPKTVQVKNEKSVDCYVRVKLVFSDDAVKDMVTLDINETNWTYSDGYYYYTSALAPGETTSALMTTVTVNDDVTAEQLDSVGAFDIDVISESCQKGDTSVFFEAWSLITENE